ncbi:hypothetical protein [Klebsiella michiganensis]|uniref:hypothetical protein n=1 Tax=Klebsiella michiganensis TaxID=1134687 RepID=UPI003F67EFDF
MLCEIIATQLGSGEFPPIIERVDIRVAADGVGQQLLTPLWRSLTGYEKQSLFMRCTGPESYFFPRPSTQHPGNSAR